METILVVDDSKVYRHAIVHLLKKLHFNVLDADNGLTGQKLLQQHTIDLVMIDIVMPELNGFALCRWIKTYPQTEHIPVIFCSSKTKAIDKYWAFKQGGDYFMSKPLTATKIVRAVDTYLQASIQAYKQSKVQKTQKSTNHLAPDEAFEAMLRSA